jgi:hypothetical protein
METRDFSGMRVRANWKDGKTYKGVHLWVFSGTKRISDSSLDEFVNDMIDARFVKFTDNFINVHCSNENKMINWFGDSKYWDNILYSMEAVAKAASDAGLRGILLDCENYKSQKNFNHTSLEIKYPGHTSGTAIQKREQWEAQVRTRGRQIMESMIKGYGSDFRLMLRQGLQFVRQIEELNREHPLSTPGANQYELVPAFINGLLEGLSGEADIVDYAPAEFAFKKGLPKSETFDQMWEILKPVDGYAVTHPDYVLPENVNRYNSKYKMGFMLWFDGNENPDNSYYDGTKWDNTNLSNNTWTPINLREWLKLCKNPKYATVLYCTIYKGNYSNNGLPDWWKVGGINQQYVDVVNQEF